MSSSLLVQENVKGAQVVLVHHSRRGLVLPKINLAPLGLFALADILDRHEINVDIIHTGVEEEINPEFCLSSELKSREPLLVGFTLAWHQQTWETVKAVREIKKMLPNSFIVVGGYTASRFAKEILEQVTEIDFVICGEAELPLLKLVSVLASLRMSDLAKVPNLLWRDDQGEILESSFSYQADNEVIRNLSFTRFELMNHFEEYLKLKMNSFSPGNELSFYFSAGRGCSASCLYCGGTRRAFRKFLKRSEVLLFEHDYVLSQLEKLSHYGIKHWNSCFDPYPRSDYYPKLFRLIRERQLHLRHIFDCFGLPTSEFVEEFALAFDTGSVLTLSPETGSEQLRSRLKTFSYSNHELFRAIESILGYDLNCSVFFSAGLPLETKENVKQTRSLIEEIVSRFPKVQVHVGAIDLEPGSAAFENQDKLGITSSMTNFESLVQIGKAQAEINYGTAELSKSDIQRALVDLREIASASC